MFFLVSSILAKTGKTKFALTVEVSMSHLLTRRLYQHSRKQAATTVDLICF